MRARAALPIVAAGLVVSSVVFADEEVTPAAPEDAPPSSEPAPPPPPPRTIPVLRVDGGFAPRWLYSLPITGGMAGVALGAERKWVAFMASLNGTFGSTQNGLGVRSGQVMFEADAVLGRFRVGGGAGYMLLGIDRAVRDETITSSGPALRASARFDIARPGGFALFARATLDYAAATKGDDTDFWGPTLGVGADFDLADRQ